MGCHVMINLIKSDGMGYSSINWLESYHHFSFANYYNPENIQFGKLRVVNDDKVKANTGFRTHPHKDMEIISYVVDGELTHADSMDNNSRLGRGQVQYMSAGTGVTHSEYNHGKDILRFLQIWFYPDKLGYEPNYGEEKFKWEDRINRWMPIASGDGNEDFPIQLHTDIHMYSTFLEEGKNLSFSVEKDRQAYLVLIEGKAKINDLELEERDALEIIEENIKIDALESSHILVIEMKKEKE